MQKKQGKKTKLPIFAIYLAVIACIAVCVLLFALLYSGTGAMLLESSPTDLPLDVAAVSPSPVPQALQPPATTPEPQENTLVADPSASRTGRLIPFLAGADWGYKNTSGSIVIAPKYSEAMEFYEENVSFAAQEGLFGLIDRNGNWVVEPCWTNVLPFSEGRAAVEFNTKWGFIDAEGNLIIDYAYREVGSFHCGRAVARSASNFSYIDVQGNVAISANWREAGDFSEDVAFVTSAEYEKDRHYIISKIGEKIATLGSAAHGTIYSDGFAAINDSGTYYFINKYGASAFDLTFDDARPFSGGYAAVKKDGAWGYINERGVLVINYKYSEAGQFSEKFAAAKDAATGLWGYVDTAGDWHIHPRYAKAGSFLDGVAVVSDGTSYFIVDTEGNETPLY